MYPICILHNTATNRYHPIAFRMYPHPADVSPFGPCRYKSLGHHTVGFDTLDEARADASRDAAFEPFEKIWEWDGVEMPAMVVWFERGSDLKISGVIVL